MVNPTHVGSGAVNANTFPFNQLPRNLIYHILTYYLDFKCKLNAEKVCKLWKEIIDMSFKRRLCVIIVDYELNDKRIRDLNLRKTKVSIVRMASFDLLGRSDAKDKQFLMTVMAKYNNLVTLCLCLKYTKCNNQILDTITKHCTQTLQYLRLEFSECSMNGRTLFITHEEVLQMGQQFPQLKYFYVDFLILHVTEQSLRSMFTKWSHIETVILHSQCFRGIVYNSDPIVNDVGLSAEFNGHTIDISGGQALAKLEMPGNVLNADAFQGLSETTANIKRLFVMKINVNAVEAICDKLPALESFGLSIESDTNDEEVYYVMENVAKLHRLKHLYIAIQSEVNISYNCIQALRSCPELKSLQLDQTLITAHTIDAIARYVPQLECLELWSSGLNRNFHICVTDEIAANIKRLENLRKLNLRGQRYVTDKCIADIVANCHLLHTIDVRKTKMGILALNVLISRSRRSDATLHVYINETPVAQVFTPRFRIFELCKHLLLNNEEYDHKIDF